MGSEMCIRDRAGDVGFDPFKFTDKGDVAKFRVAELKHGTFSRSERRVKAVGRERIDWKYR